MTAPPPGWYPSPDTAGMHRWWDGQQWTDRVLPTVQTQSAAAGAAGTVGGSAYALRRLLVLLGVVLVLSSFDVVPRMMTARVGAGETMTYGTVVGVDRSRGSRSFSCTPEATVTVGGTTYRVSPPPMWDTCPPIGTTITVIYPTSDPREARTAPSIMLLVELGSLPVAGVALVALGTRRGVAGLRRPRS